MVKKHHKKKHYRVIKKHCKAYKKHRKNTRKKRVNKIREQVTEEENRFEWYKEFKLELCCEMCGKKPKNKKDTRNFHFHHNNPDEKKFEIAKGIRFKSFDVLTNEIAKCRYLCKKCHRAWHHEHGNK